MCYSAKDKYLGDPSILEDNIGLNTSHEELLGMLAQNPKTGKPIRILRSEASLWRNAKTLVWLQDQDSSVSWDRWDTACIGLSDIQKWKSAGKRIDYFLLSEATPEAVEFFLRQNPKDYTMMFVSKALVFAIGWQKFRALQITNVIVLEEAHLMYPYLGKEWDTTNVDGLLMIAAILRMSKVIGIPEGFASERITSFQSHGITIRFSSETPMPLWYITQFYKPEKARREREILKCLQANIACPLIDKLVVLNEKDYSQSMPSSSKLHQEIVGKRLSYKIVLEWIQKNVPDNVLCIFGNADIYLDAGSWRDIWSVDMQNVFLALLRWDVQEDGTSKIFGPRNDSQDTWGILSQSVKSKEWDWKALDIPFGQAGCDNAITVELLRKKFLVVNPAISLKTHHLQLTNYRTYDPKDVVDRPCYMYVDPTGIHDMEPVFDLRPYKHDTLQFSSFERRVRSTKQKALDVYCKMLERGERYFWKANGTNPYPNETVQLLKYTDAFQTPQGLAYGYNRIFVGNDEVNKEAWSRSELSPIHPAYESERCYAVPWKDEFSRSPESYILQYLPKVLHLRAKYGKGEFFAPEKDVVQCLECFKWDESSVPVLQHRPNVQIWCKELIQYPFLSKNEVHAEDIAILRSMMKDPWESNTTVQKWVVMIDGTYITTEMVRIWESMDRDSEWAVVYEGRTSPERILEKMKGARGFVFYGGSRSISRWGWAWALPKEAFVIEVQNEMDPDGEAAHMSGAAGLHHSFVIVPRAETKITQEMILQEVSLTMKAVASSAGHSSKKPTMYMPRKSLTGFFGHAGDSFREMVNLWAEKGYVEVVEDPKATQIWLGGVGETLLYDRPTLDWLFASPSEEQTWKRGLFGNPAPSESGGSAKSWIFWPRRPRLVEELVESGAALRGWEERTNNLVFYGKIENKVQEKRRQAQDWSSICDEFEMAKGESAPYKYSQKEYLERLGQAKFGLCLAGFGKKCHREIECMAMGCVPVCASDVDMDNYANPPQEGVQYLRVKNPEDAKEKIDALSREQWQTMSDACKAWWKANASVEGSWVQTSRLAES